MRRIRVLVSGRVQAVFFRQRAAQLARAEGVAGWIRNLPDGRVEAVFEGADEGVHRLLEWCRQGPELAVVDGVEVMEESPEGLDRFEVRG